MRSPKLEQSAIESQLTGMPGWSISGGKLHREYKFADFPHAMGFMTTAALLIQSLDHHPEWTNVYNRVTVDLTTHVSGGITAKDFELARTLEKIAGEMALAAAGMPA